MWGVLVLILANSAFIPIQALLFPDAGGFTRSIIFVRPQDSLPGYYIIVDEIKPTIPWETGEVLFHSYGSLTIDGANAVWQEGSVSLNITVLAPAVTITRDSGTTYDHGVANTIEYVKIKPLQAGPVTVVTLLFPNNGSYPWPSISVSETDDQIAAQIGTRDYLLVNKHVGSIITNSFLTTNAKSLFARANETAPGVEYVVVNSGTFCEVSGASVLTSSEPTTAAFMNGTGLITPSSLFNYVAPVESSTPFTRDLSSLTHPYILVNDTGLPALRARCNGTTPGPWQGWYSYINATAQALLALPPENFTGPQAAIVAFVGYVDDNATCLAKTGAVLKTLDTRQDSYPELINRGEDIIDFALAYDFCYSSLSTADQQDITNKLGDLADPLYDEMYVAPKNNWRLVMAGGLGMVGFVLNNLAYISRAQDQVDMYLRDCVRGNGACFEGQSYMRFAMEMGVRFCLALRQLDGNNYFTNPRLLAGLNFSVYSSTPDGSAPLYEDCTGSNMAPEAIWSCNYVPDPLLAGELKWYADRNGFSWLDPYAVCAYTHEVTPIAPPNTTTSVAYGDDDYAFLRSGWDENATYLSLSNKDYAQSHTHYDENSIELYAYGKKLLANGGYPGFHKPGQAWAVSTEAQNTVVIGGRGQSASRSNGLNPAILTNVVDLISSDAYLCYQHPFSVTKVPAFLVAYISLIALGVAILATIKRMHRINGREVKQPVESMVTQHPMGGTAKPTSPAGRTFHILKRALFVPTFDFKILTSPKATRVSKIAHLLGSISVTLLLEGMAIMIVVVMTPFITVYTSSGNYTLPILIYNGSLIVVPILLAGLGFFSTRNALRMRRRLYRSLMRPMDDAQESNLKTLLKVSNLYSVFFVLIALAFLAWGVAPIFATTFDNAFTQGGEVQVVVQYFIAFLQQCVTFIPVIFVFQFLFRVWQANFIGLGLQSETLFGNARVQDYRRTLLLPILVTVILWFINLTVLFAANLGLMGFLNTLTMESF